MGVANFAATLLGILAAGVGQPARAREGAAAPVPAAPRLSVTPDKGFVDDAFALDASGKRLVLIHTDREEFQRVEIYDLDAAKTGATKPTPIHAFDLFPPSRGVESIAFLPDGTSLLLVGASAGSDAGRVAETMDFSGKVLGKMSVPTEFGIAGTGQDAKLVTLERGLARARGDDVTYVVSPFRLPSLKPAAKPRTYPLGADGLLRPSGLGAVAFFDGYSKLLCRRPGAYDKKKDVRQPEGQAVLDLLSGKSISAGPIEDVYAWARVSRLRPLHPNRTAFVQLAGANAGPTAPDVHPGAGGGGAKATGVELVDPAGRLTPLDLPIPFRLYDRLTLKDEEGPPGVLTFALEVDPVNPDAVARKKADPRALDVYGLGGAEQESSRPARLRARIALGTQPIVWSAAGDRVVVLRRFKSFARGGDRLDVYDLAK